MIAVDLDGTLLRPDHTVGSRTAAALRAAQEAGVVVLPATGRPSLKLGGLLPEFLTELVVCSNGAVVADLRHDRILIERPIVPEVLRGFVPAFAGAVPGARFASVTEGGHGFLPGPGYLDLMRAGDHARDIDTVVETDLDALTAVPSVKLVARHAEWSAEELLAAAQALAFDGVTPTISGVPFLEVAAAGVTKASALALIAAERGIDPADVLVFGDSANDLDMIAWAGRGVAMGNAWPEVQAVADEVTAANTEDGIALIVERELGLSAPAAT